MAKWRREALQSAKRARRRVLVVGLGFVAASVATTTTLVVRANERERAHAREGVAVQAREGAALVDAFVAGEIEMLQAVAAAPSVVDMELPVMREFFARVDPVGAQAGGGVAWVDRTGRLQVLVANAPDAPPADLSHRDYVARTLATKQPVVSDGLISSSSVPIVVVTAPTFDATGAPSGLVLRGNRLDETNRLVTALAAIEGASLVDGAGALLVRDGPVATGTLELAATAPGDPAAGTRVVRATPGHVVASHAVATTPWTVVVDVRESTLYGSLDDQRTRQLLGIALGTLLAIFTVVALSRRSAAQAFLLAALGHQRQQAGALEKIAAGLSASLDDRAVAAVVTREVRETLGADAVHVGMVDDAERELRWIANVGYRGTDAFPTMPLDFASAVTDTVRTRAPIEITGVEEFTRRYPALRDHVAGEGDATWMQWPMLADDRCVGEIGLLWRRRRTIDDDDRRFVATVAELLTDALRRTRAYADEQDLAQALQRGALTRLPRIEGLTLRADYRPAAHITVGGDWFDVLELPDGTVFLCVGDVVGHGLDAVEDMVQLRNAARAFAVDALAPADIVGRLDRFCATVTSGRYATVAAAIVDPARRRLTYALAGHPPPLVRLADGSVRRLDAATGAPLGIGSTRARSQETVELPGGATLVLYTDGLVESRAIPIDAGIDRLETAIAAADFSRPDVLDVLIAAVLADDHHRKDDLCVLAARLAGGEVRG